MDLTAATNFEEQYLALRKKENRLYSDDQVLRLPEIAIGHPHYKEWIMRKTSMNRLIGYLERKSQPLSILEVGCGNGWLSHRLSRIADAWVTGIDINSWELQQAIRVFKNCLRLKYVYGEMESGLPDDTKFDVILFAASLQYFPSLEKIINLALRYLSETGEIHIIDTYFYTARELPGAAKRSADYFSSMGFPEMIDHYFHHGIENLGHFHFTTLHRTSWLENKLNRNNNPFPWICIKRQ